MNTKKNKTSPSSRSQPRTLLCKLANHPEMLERPSFKQQYGAICFRRTAADGLEILLITSRDTRRWIIPKGWPMRGKKPHEAAAVEAWEEAGVRGKVRKKPVGRYTYLKVLDDGVLAPCVVDVFQIQPHPTKRRG